MMNCPICTDLNIEPDHPNYPNPELGDDWHGQYNPECPEEIVIK